MNRRALAASFTAPRGIAALLLFTLAVAGCGVVGRTSVKTVQLALQGTPDVQPSAAEVAATPYPQLKVSGPNGGAVLVLGNIDAGRQAWYSSEGSIVFLQDGLLVGTHGGTPALQQMWIEGDSPFHALHTLQGTVTVQRRYDLMPGYRYGVTVTGMLERLGTEPVDILGTVRTLVHVRETLRGARWKGQNHYWVDPASGFIWKSQQMIAPGTRLDITQLKPYSLDLQRR